MNPSLGIVTVAYRSEETLGGFLSSVRRDPAGNEAPIAVVDNGSANADLSRAIAEAHGAAWIPADSNRGYGAGINLGASQLPRTDYLLIANPDVVVGDGAISTLLAAAEEIPDAGAVGPRILTSEGETYPSARALPSLRVGVGHAVLSRAYPHNKWSRRYQGRVIDSDVRRDAGWLSGSFLLVRREVFDALGGFDESYFMYFEDVDLGARIGALGWRNVYEPSATVTHAGAKSTSTAAGAMIREHHRSAYRYLSRRYSAWYLWPLRAVLRVAVGVRGWWVGRSAGQ